jgi:hypothetical protein
MAVFSSRIAMVIRGWVARGVGSEAGVETLLFQSVRERKERNMIAAIDPKIARKTNLQSMQLTPQLRKLAQLQVWTLLVAPKVLTPKQAAEKIQKLKCTPPPSATAQTCNHHCAT